MLKEYYGKGGGRNTLVRRKEEILRSGFNWAKHSHCKHFLTAT